MMADEKIKKIPMNLSLLYFCIEKCCSKAGCGCRTCLSGIYRKKAIF